MDISFSKLNNSSQFSDQGYYVYIESSYPRQYDDRARLISPTIAKNHKSCVTFYYFMFGSDIERLNVYIQIQNGSLGKALWTHQGTLDPRWYYGQFEVAYSSPYQVGTF